MITNIPFNQEPVKQINWAGKTIECFAIPDSNIDHATVESFGDEWTKFSDFDQEEIIHAGNEYFDIIDFSQFPENAVVLDAGCGTGRWSQYIAYQKKDLHIFALDPSEAILSAAELTAATSNIHLIKASIDNIPFEDNTFDFVISLGVLHHIPDTQKALEKCIAKLKSGGKCLIYLYYALDNRGAFYKMLFHTSTFFRRGISKMPKGLKKFVCDLIAFLVYCPFVLLAKFTGLFSKRLASKIPLSYYSNKSLNIIRNDALDRFGTPLEQRFSKVQITEMLTQAGMDRITFSDNSPFWHVTAVKK